MLIYKRLWRRLSDLYLSVSFVSDFRLSNFVALTNKTTVIMEKLLKRTLLVIMALLPSLSVPVMASSDEPDDIPLRPANPEHLQPRSIEPECYYQDGYVYIIGSTNVTSISATVTRLSDNVQWSNSSTSNTLQIAVPTDAGTYRLELSLSDGNSYYGDYIL